MKSTDEIIEIPYQYDRVRYCKDKDPEFYSIMFNNKETITIRVVKVKLSTSGEEILITKLTREEVNTEEIYELCKLR